MAEDQPLHRPWLVAVWPGMGNVAMAAGYYLMAKLGMQVLAEYPPGELFDVEHVEVHEGLIQTGRRPRNRFFTWRDPRQWHDIVVFIGEAQPPLGKYTFCHKLIEYAGQLGVERVFTFAAMAGDMHPEDDSRVFAAATDEEILTDLKKLDLEIVEDGHITGLNGVLLGAAAESGLPGACLLGEMPHIFHQFPFPKASLAVLEVFTRIAGIELDFQQLSQEAEAMEEKFGELLDHMERALEEEVFSEEGSSLPELEDEQSLEPEDEQRIERLFGQARDDRSKAYELKQELDRLGVFKDYEDRFLDLFRPSS